jgi:hypothetical protein
MLPTDVATLFYKVGLRPLEWHCSDAVRPEIHDCARYVYPDVVGALPPSPSMLVLPSPDFGYGAVWW